MLSKLSPYSFVVTILWFGFVLALAFIETPLRFQPERISTDEALSIGFLVFHALNTAEIIFATTLVVAFLLAKNTSRTPKRLLTVLVMMLASQTMMLYIAMDPRVEAILRGEQVPAAPYHLVYIVMDVVKLGLLAWLAVIQIRQSACGVNRGGGTP